MGYSFLSSLLFSFHTVVPIPLVDTPHVGEHFPTECILRCLRYYLIYKLHWSKHDKNSSAIWKHLEQLLKLITIPGQQGLQTRVPDLITPE